MRRALLHPAVLTQLFRPLFAFLRKLQQRLDCLRVGDTASQPITPLCRVEQLVSRLAQPIRAWRVGHPATLTLIKVA